MNEENETQEVTEASEAVADFPEGLPTHEDLIFEMMEMRTRLDGILKWCGGGAEEPRKSAKQLANKARKSVQGVLAKFENHPEFPTVHLPGNWPKAADAALAMAALIANVLGALVDADSGE